MSLLLRKKTLCKVYEYLNYTIEFLQTASIACVQCQLWSYYSTTFLTYTTRAFAGLYKMASCMVVLGSKAAKSSWVLNKLAYLMQNLWAGLIATAGKSRYIPDRCSMDISLHKGTDKCE